MEDKSTMNETEILISTVALVDDCTIATKAAAF